MAWCFRRSARNPAPAPTDRIQVTFHKDQEVVDTRVEPQQAAGPATPQPCKAPPPATRTTTKAKAAPMEPDTIAQLLAKNAI